jgi:hypothetical protein
MKIENFSPALYTVFLEVNGMMDRSLAFEKRELMEGFEKMTWVWDEERNVEGQPDFEGGCGVVMSIPGWVAWHVVSFLLGTLTTGVVIWGFTACNRRSAEGGQWYVLGP